MLELVNSISDLKKLDVKQLSQLCADIRQKLIADVQQSGGHLASNLGAVELTVALHYVFDERDKIVWDVGHQSYVHKILTGRGENFCSLRQKNGLSGFPDCDESATDSFNTGHAGTAISAGLGLAKARDVNGDKYNVVAVVGDGSMTCGLTYEALNNVKDTKMLIVLNDNNMSISDNVGAATLNMSKIRVGKYDERKEKLKRNLQRIPLIGKGTYKFLRWCKRRAKRKFVRNSYFDIFDLKYIGIVDGNEIKDLVYYLTRIKNNVHKPTVLHVITKKGKGYAPAETDPENFHAVPSSRSQVNQLESSVVVGDTLVKLASANREVVAVCAAMSKATGLETFQKVYPERFYDVGIAESHAVTFAAGLAKGGAHPFVAIYSTFLQRSYDQILHDAALQNLPVTLLIDRAGFVGADGKTHQGLFDLSYLSQIPNLKIYSPSTYCQLSQMITASLSEDGPVAIRYARTLSDAARNYTGGWNVVKSAEREIKVVILAVGSRMLDVALQVANVNTEVVDVTTVKPLDCKYLDGLSSDVKVLTLEENVIRGGFGESVLTYLSQHGKMTNTVRIMGVADNFVSHATVAEQLAACNLDASGVKDVLDEMLR